jgi:hypothetical protein
MAHPVPPKGGSIHALVLAPPWGGRGVIKMEMNENYYN